MQKLPFNINQIFDPRVMRSSFNEIALRTFSFQYFNNPVYKSYCDMIQKDVQSIQHYEEIPFLPISFFKSHEVKCFDSNPQRTFLSSGTTSEISSKHEVYDLSIYESSFNKTFELFYGSPEDFIVLGLLPSYLERDGSSLVYMVDQLIRKTKNPKSDFYLDDYKKLIQTIDSVGDEKQILLIGVSYALLDLAENFAPNLSGCIVMETGGMKGKRKELTKEELHDKLKRGFNLDKIHSEYGMTELLSQAYSYGDGVFSCPPWMKVLIRDRTDPFSLTNSKTGGINVIDLANIYSCSFIATEDLGRKIGNQFEVKGRFDQADIRGCNLLIE